jgi:hypoxanthine phosphoribosyltransferase
LTDIKFGALTLSETLITQEQIEEKIAVCGKRICDKYRDKPLLLIGLLKGGFVFLSDLARAIDIPCAIEFITTSSYGNGTTAGKLAIHSHIKADISAYHVIVVEDIIDTGHTLSAVSKYIRGMNPLSLEIITLLDKPSRREVDFNADESLFTIEDRFVVGYGLDCAEIGRNLPYIAVVAE